MDVEVPVVDCGGRGRTAPGAEVGRKPTKDVKPERRMS